MTKDTSPGVSRATTAQDPDPSYGYGLGTPDHISFRKWAVKSGRLDFSVGARNRTPVVESQLPLLGVHDGRHFVVHALVTDSVLRGHYLPDGWPLIVELLPGLEGDDE